MIKSEENQNYSEAGLMVMVLHSVCPPLWNLSRDSSLPQTSTHGSKQSLGPWTDWCPHLKSLRLDVPEESRQRAYDTLDCGDWRRIYRHALKCAWTANKAFLCLQTTHSLISECIYFLTLFNRERVIFKARICIGAFQFLESLRLPRAIV